MLLPDAVNLNARRIRDEGLRQPDTAVIRAGGVANVHEGLLVRSIASHGTIANLVRLAIAARRHGWLGTASAGPSFVPTIRHQVLVAQPEFNQRKRLELATALALAQLRQNLVGEHA